MWMELNGNWDQKVPKTIYRLPLFSFVHPGPEQRPAASTDRGAQAEAEEDVGGAQSADAGPELHLHLHLHCPVSFTCT